MRNIAGNLCIFMSLFALLVFVKGLRLSFAKYILLLLAISASIECLQLVENITYLSGIRVRIVDIDDIICNVTGGILEYLICILAERRTSHG